MAICPYPQQLEAILKTTGEASYFVRPIRPEDASSLCKFALAIPKEDLWHNFFSALRDNADETAARLS